MGNEIVMTGGMTGDATGNSSAIAAAEHARAIVQARYMVAINRPRDEDMARERILRDCKRPEFAERVVYRKPVGGGQYATGPSIRFAEAALRAWGNLDTRTDVLFDDIDTRRIQVTCCDLESNTTTQKVITVSKTVERKHAKDREVIGQRENSYGDTVYICRATEDEMQQKEAALISKALRNEGLRLIPSDIVDEGIRVATATLNSRDNKDPDAARKKILDSFSSVGVSASDLKKFLRHDTQKITPAELVTLREVFSAIATGDTTWLEVMATEKEKENGPSPMSPATDDNEIPAGAGGVRGGAE